MTVATCPHQALAQRQAADWFALLSSGEASEHERRQWLEWRQAAPVHEAAWCQVEEVVARFQSLPPALAQHTLDAPVLDRRAALKLLATLLAIGGAAAAGLRSELAQHTFADLSTGVGERRIWTLADQTRLHLNARSAASVQLQGARRQVRLYAGEFVFQVPERSGLQPLQITTEHGRIEAEAARFMVSQRAGRVAVSLFEGALRLQPDAAPWQALGAGQSARLLPGRGVSVGPLQPQVAAWEQGLVFAEGMPLRHYLAQLAPYRTGLLSCDAVAGRLRVSGVFSLDQSDRLLAQLPDILPVRVRYFSRYWVRVEALG